MYAYTCEFNNDGNIMIICVNENILASYVNYAIRNKLNEISWIDKRLCDDGTEILWIPK